MKKIYGIIGYPIKHSLSPKMHNAAFRHLGIDAEYRPFEVKPEGLEDFFKRKFLNEGLCGLNITIPHKETSIEYMDGLKGDAGLIGAINTVVLEEGRLVGYNTDAIGFIESLKKDLEFNARKKKAFILGAGGAARAVSFSLFIAGIKEIIVADIDNQKAKSLVGDLQKSGYDAMAVEYNKKAIGELAYNSDLLINATPCGMKKDDPELIDSKFLHDKLAVFDLIYNPPETRLIKEAKKKGCKAVNGLGMLVYQGAASFELWTKKRAPVEVIRKALL